MLEGTPRDRLAVLCYHLPEPQIDPQVEYGTITIVFHDCNNATLTYDIPSLGLMGTIELTRLTEDNLALCEELNAALQNDQ